MRRQDASHKEIEFKQDSKEQDQQNNFKSSSINNLLISESAIYNKIYYIPENIHAMTEKEIKLSIESLNKKLDPSESILSFYGVLMHLLTNKKIKIIGDELRKSKFTKLKLDSHDLLRCSNAILAAIFSWLENSEFIAISLMGYPERFQAKQIEIFMETLKKPSCDIISLDLSGLILNWNKKAMLFFMQELAKTKVQVLDIGNSCREIDLYDGEILSIAEFATALLTTNVRLFFTHNVFVGEARKDFVFWISNLVSEEVIASYFQSDSFVLQLYKNKIIISFRKESGKFVKKILDLSKLQPQDIRFLSHSYIENEDKINEPGDFKDSCPAFPLKNLPDPLLNKLVSLSGCKASEELLSSKQEEKLFQHCVKDFRQQQKLTFFQGSLSRWDDELGTKIKYFNAKPFQKRAYRFLGQPPIYTSFFNHPRCELNLIKEIFDYAFGSIELRFKY